MQLAYSGEQGSSAFHHSRIRIAVTGIKAGPKKCRSTVQALIDQLAQYGRPVASVWSHGLILKGQLGRAHGPPYVDRVGAIRLNETGNSLPDDQNHKRNLVFRVGSVFAGTAS
jgi:hypothetical protein